HSQPAIIEGVGNSTRIVQICSTLLNGVRRTCPQFVQAGVTGFLNLKCEFDSRRERQFRLEVTTSAGGTSAGSQFGAMLRAALSRVVRRQIASDYLVGKTVPADMDRAPSWLF